MKKTIVLIVLDGWGIGPHDDTNPIHTSGIKTIPALQNEYPTTSLEASGIAVGLPWGEIGNSEVGHLTLGAGKVLYQHYPRITLAIRDETFFTNPVLIKARDHIKKNDSSLCLVGLLSKGNVHASIDHLLALIEFAKRSQVPVKLHLFADGKDWDPHTLEKLLAMIPQDDVGSISGRYYAMDREENWRLVEQAYRAIVGDIPPTPKEKLGEIIKLTYEKNGREEFLPPTLLDPTKSVTPGDALLFFNFREDSMREIASAFCDPTFDKFSKKNLENLFVATMTQYHEGWPTPVAFPSEKVDYPLGRILSESGKTQLRLAETYKYAHVTYFFNALIEAPFKNEYRVLLPSKQIPHPDEEPEMMAQSITDRLVEAIQNKAFDFILVNYANPDTIAHTGNFAACEKAVQFIDAQIERVVNVTLENDATVLITSDHGNVEGLIDPATGRAETGHNPSHVPLYLIASELKGKKFLGQESFESQSGGVLADVAPTILELLGIKKPAEMTGESVLKNIT